MKFLGLPFGRQHIGKPTPTSIGFKVTIISIICPVVSVWLGTASYIPDKVSNILISILSLFTALANALKPLFGVEVDQPSVPTNQVTEIETDPKDVK